MLAVSSGHTGDWRVSDVKPPTRTIVPRLRAVWKVAVGTASRRAGEVIVMMITCTLYSFDSTVSEAQPSLIQTVQGRMSNFDNQPSMPRTAGPRLACSLGLR